MRDTLNKLKDSKGFTLIEIAIVVLIVGMLVAPAMHLYTRKIETDKFKDNIVSLERAQTYISGFRDMYGRYPCPAALDAQPGDANYGYEDCVSLAPAIERDISNSVDPALLLPGILIGSLPFRQMNLQEQQSFDGYGNRFTYAVTEFLTDENTFDENLGGVSVVDINGVNALARPDSAPFVIVSHGKDGQGAITRDGVRMGTCASGALQDENCDSDGTFMQGNAAVGYDDRLVHSVKALVSPWAYSDTSLQDVVLNDGGKFGIGTESPIELASASELTILENLAGDAVILASGGAMVSNSICDYGDTGCFTPSLIAGSIAASEGMTCGSNEFMVGVENGGPVCETSIRFECPVGQFLTGVGSSGELICEGAPAPACLNQNVTSSCGPSGTLAAIYDSGYREVEAGECYMLNNFSSATAASQPDIPSLQAYVDGLNTAPRTGPSACPSKNLVRDSYQCLAGVWTPTRNHELWRYNGNFPSNRYQNSRIATTSGPAYSLTASRTGNDCWCREDYQLVIDDCPTGSTGNSFTVQKHRCPQTRGEWADVYTNNTAFCSCAPYTNTNNQSCTSYYGVPGGSMSGTVTTTYNNTCSGGTVVTDPSPTVTNNCTCQNNPSSPVETTVNCPSGQTNSFTFGGNSYTGVAQIRRNTWSCPNGFGNPVSSAAGAGSWSGAVTVHTEACACNSTLTSTVTDACPSGYTGAGIQYLREWDCTIPPSGGWEPRSDWDLISNSCAACTWKRPSTTPSNNPTTGIGDAIGTGGCACGASGLCYEKAGSGYANYTSCNCQP